MQKTTKDHCVSKLLEMLGSYMDSKKKLFRFIHLHSKYEPIRPSFFCDNYRRLRCFEQKETKNEKKIHILVGEGVRTLDQPMHGANAARMEGLGGCKWGH